jgi:sterol desaturase/sphingolipid hydroxylase (fatty acid hydroxylase superfamily)
MQSPDSLYKPVSTCSLKTFFMNTNTINPDGKTINFPQWQCYIIYVLLLSPFGYSIILLENKNRFFFQALLFFTGWLTFTFFEYISHRFWMHTKEKKHPGKSLQRHMNHHRHPTELKITDGMRNKLLAGNVLLVAAAFAANNYFIAFAGFYTGFVYYCFMHVFLHKRWAKKIFPRLQVSHIHHHCKHPDRCFGISVTWWDTLFNTNIPGDIIISDRVVQFYFGNDDH